MWAEKDRMKAGDVIRHSITGEIAIILLWKNGRWEARSVLNKPQFCTGSGLFAITHDDEFWDVLE